MILDGVYIRDIGTFTFGIVGVLLTLCEMIFVVGGIVCDLMVVVLLISLSIGIGDRILSKIGKMIGKLEESGEKSNT